jgi:hypothetical protein
MTMDKCARRLALLAGVAGLALAHPACAADPATQSADMAQGTDVAAGFGAREAITGAKLSPDGLHVLYLAADGGTGTTVMVADSDAQSPPHSVLQSSGKPERLQWCDWADNSRIVCDIYGIPDSGTILLPFTRLIAIDRDGGNLKSLSQASQQMVALRISQFDGDIIDWNQGQTGKLLMERDHVPEASTGTNLASDADGLGVDLVDTHSLQSSKIEEAARNADSYISDGKGTVRLMGTESSNGAGYLRGVESYYYRRAGSRRWEMFSQVVENGPGLRPLTVDPVADVAYCLDNKNGHDELYKVALDGSMRAELAYSDPKVDVDDIVRLGRQARLIGVTTVQEKRSITYFDKEYAALAAALGKALGGRQIEFASSSADEQKLLLFAGSDVDAGAWYVFDRKTMHLNQIALVRPQLEHVTLATQTPIAYRAADGTMIPAYLTLPPGGPQKGLPAIVMPHGGPSARDEWGFDWLSQFFAARAMP